MAYTETDEMLFSGNVEITEASEVTMLTNYLKHIQFKIREGRYDAAAASAHTLEALLKGMSKTWEIR